MLKMLRELQFAAIIASTRYHWGFFFLETFKNREHLNHLKITIFALNSCFSSSFSTILSRGYVTQLQSKIVIIIITVVIIEKQEWTRHLLKHIPFQEHFYSIT